MPHPTGAWGFILGAVFLLWCSAYRPTDGTLAPPRITSPRLTEATGGISYSYRAAAVDSSGASITIAYSGYPHWLTEGQDSLWGTPPDGSTDTGFVVLASNGSLADTAHVRITITPTIVVYGDTRTNHEIHRQITNLILRVVPAVAFHTGDLVEDGRVPAQWTTFNEIAAPLRAMAEFYPAMGNHENQSPLFRTNFNLPNNREWYSVDRNRIHFVVLNSNVATDTASEQYRWLNSDLAHVGDSIKFIAAVFHHPPYSSGWHVEDEKGLQRTLVPLFQRYGVDIVFNGHEHEYERLYCGGIRYVITGGGGAPLYGRLRQSECSQVFARRYHFCKVSRVGSRLIIRVYDIDSQLIDEFAVEKT